MCSTINTFPALGPYVTMFGLLKGKKTDQKKTGSSVDSGFAEESSSHSGSSASIPDLDERDAIENRIDTFFNNGWFRPVSMKALAEAGFMFTGNGDAVKCVSCGGQISEWNAGDVPLKRHKQNFPKCSFVKYKCKQKKKQRDDLSFDGARRPGNEDLTDEGDDNDGDNVIFISEFDRLMTFRDWSLLSPVDRYDLAATGFYRVSSSSEAVQCYACGIKVEDWILGDQPKKKHKKLNAKCPHLQGKNIYVNEHLHSSEKQQAVNINIQDERIKTRSS